jgi:phage terminase Nu1 subunit (DNA packaging protein)
MAAITKAEFARHLGVRRGTVTYWAKQGRLVLTPDGRVDLEASIERLRQTQRNLGMSIRWREYRERAGKATGGGVEPLPEVADYEFWRAMRCHYQALATELRYRRAAGELFDREHVEYQLCCVAVELRVALENLPDRLAPLLVATCDEDECRRILRIELQRIIEDHEHTAAQARHELERGAG